MARVTVFGVQAYTGRGELRRGALREYQDRDEALAVGELLAAHVPAVIVFRVTGEPDFDAWEEPQVIARHGRAGEVSEAA